MAWEISISAEGWDEIREALEEWSKEDLISAICDDFYETLVEYGIENGMAQGFADTYGISMRMYAPHDALVDTAFKRIEANNTCDNGGFAYWIDRDGHHKVELKKRED